MTSILVTGGAGYIGSHTTTSLLNSGHDVTILDNLSNCDATVIDRIERISATRPELIVGDVRDDDLLNQIFQSKRYDAVIHFAGLKAVGESVSQPIEYYDNNVTGTLRLLNAMRRANVKTLVFSSSATVYGDPASVPISEDFPLSATNPYGRSKLIIEEMLGDLHHSDNTWRIASLRYFNPVGAHESGNIGENPRGIPNNLVPYITQVAAGQQSHVNVFGADYPTRDGTGVRDYIHVMDLAEGHMAALTYLEQKGGLLTVNLGTGTGNSVLEMIKVFEKVSGNKVPYQIVDRRPGDIAECWALPDKAERLLGWKASRGIDEMCADAWRWYQNTL
ncbi:MAG: UDP-glucose 4-epimerase GalE [Alphaproteobacteria bacterium]